MQAPTMKVWNRAAGLGRGFLVLAGFFVSALQSTQALPADEGLTLVVQPILSQEKTKKAFQPLADYIAKVTGRPSKIRTSPNFLVYWNEIRRKEKNMLFLDAAHFTAYRNKKLGFKILAKIPDVVSYSIIVRDDQFVHDPTELTGKVIASLGAPSIGAVRLNGMFPNPMRQPIILEVQDSESAIKALLNKKAFAAILPTPIVSREMAQGSPINIVLATEPIPHIAVSASPDIDPVIRETIRRALLEATQSEEGKAMLKGIGFPRFDPASPAIYKGQDEVLQAYWGY